MIPVPEQRRYLLWIGLLGLVVICIIAMIATALRIERSLGQQVNVAITAAGFSRINTESRGRDIALKGYVSSSEALVQARRLAESVHGVRRVDTQLKIQSVQLPWIRLVPLAEPFEGGFLLTGMLPRQEVLDDVKSVFAGSGLEVDYQISIDPEVSIPKWLGILDTVVQLGAELDAFRMELGAGEIAVGGRLTGVVEVDSRLDSLHYAANAAGVRVVNQIALMPGVESAAVESD